MYRARIRVLQFRRARAGGLLVDWSFMILSGFYRLLVTSSIALPPPLSEVQALRYSNCSVGTPASGAHFFDKGPATFRLADLDGDGHLSEEEIEHGAAHLFLTGLPKRAAHTAALDFFRSADLNSDGQLSRAEFIHAIRSGRAGAAPGSAAVGSAAVGSAAVGSWAALAPPPLPPRRPAAWRCEPR